MIDAATVSEFLPQATNLQSLSGICFKKGCYTGQEMVARAKFRGANKRAMFTLIGHSRHVPVAGDDAERQLGENWRRTGTILAAVRLSDDRVLVQIVMNNDTEEDAVFRIREDEESRLSLSRCRTPLLKKPDFPSSRAQRYPVSAPGFCINPY